MTLALALWLDANIEYMGDAFIELGPYCEPEDTDRRALGVGDSKEIVVGRCAAVGE